MKMNKSGTNEIQSAVRVRELTLRKIRENADNAGEPRRTAPRMGRRGMVIAAALSLILAFAGVAYAAGLFDIGIIKSEYGNFDARAIEGSPQFMAMQEYLTYWEEAFAKGDKAVTNVIFTDDGGALQEFSYPEKIAELCEKYDLRGVENIRYSPATFGETLSRAGVENFLGTFGDLTPDTKNGNAGAGDTVYKRAGFITDVDGNAGAGDTDAWFDLWNSGSFEIGVLLDDEANDAYWMVECLKTDVFRSPNNGSWASSLAEYGGSKAATVKEWEYTTKSGYNVECALIKGSSFRDNSEQDEGYNFMLPAGDYMVAFHMRQPIPKGQKGQFTKAGLEKIIEKFNFQNLETN